MALAFNNLQSLICHKTKKPNLNFDQNFEPGNHFVDLADGNWANNLVLKRGNSWIYLLNSKGRMRRCILKMLHIYQLLNEIYFEYKWQQKMIRTLVLTVTTANWFILMEQIKP